MDKFKQVLKNNRKSLLIGCCTLAVLILLFAGIKLKQKEINSYYYENKIEAVLAQKTIDYLETKVVMKKEALEEMGNTAVKTYNTIIDSGTEEITEDHSKAVEMAIRDSLYQYTEDENLSEADYEVLAAGISKIIWDTLLTQLVNSELAINVNYREEMNALTSDIEAQLADIEERISKLRVNTTIKFNTEELEQDINRVISDAVLKSEGEMNQRLDNQIAGTVEKQLQNKEKELTDSINNEISATKENIIKEVINSLKNNLVNGKDGTDGKNGTNGKDGVDGKNGTDGKDGVDGKNGLDGKDGTDGKNGKSTYMAYADDASGNGFSLLPTETTKYIGTCITDADKQPQTVDSYSNWQPYRSYIMTITTDAHGESTLHIR